MSIRPQYVASAILFSSAFFISGCVNPAKFPKRASVADVVHNARCELFRAVERNASAHSWLLDWTAAFDFNIKVDKVGSGETSGSLVIPFNSGKFTLGFLGNFSKQVFNSVNVKFQINHLYNYNEYGCSLVGNPGKKRRLLAGEIGLGSWLDRTVQDIEESQISARLVKDGAAVEYRRGDDGQYERDEKDQLIPRELNTSERGHATGITYALEFIVTANGNLSPAVETVRRNTFNATLKLERKRTATHKLSIALTPRSIPVDDKHIRQAIEFRNMARNLRLEASQLRAKAAEETAAALRFGPDDSAKAIEARKAAKRDSETAKRKLEKARAADRKASDIMRKGVGAAGVDAEANRRLDNLILQQTIRDRL